MNKDILSEVSDDQKFWLANGKVAGSLRELYEILKDLDEETFSCHVNEEKNDFYNWVKDVYQDRKLADDLLWCTNKESMLFCLKTRIEEAERINFFNDLPKGYGNEENEPNADEEETETGERLKIFNELPKSASYENKKIKKLSNHSGYEAKKPLVTQINLKEIRSNEKKKTETKKMKNLQIKGIQNTKKETFNKVHVKKIRKDSVENLIKKIKEVHGVG